MIGTRTKRPARDRTLMLGLLTAALVVLTLIAARPAHAETFTVNSTGNAGVESTDGICDSNITAVITCTLREAIQESNASTTVNDTINFAIPDDPNIAGLEVKTISPSSALPTITDNVTINGYSQSGAAANTATTNANNAVLKIELNGAGVAFFDGLFLSGDEAEGTTIKGLAINRFGGGGLSINTDDTVIEGNFIGTDPTGAIDEGNDRNGVRVNSSDNRIGGSANAAQNIISGNGGDGVSVVGADSTGNTISNNHIGTDADAGEDLGNSENGVFVTSPGVIVGGNDANGANGAGQDNGDVEGEGNIISGNDQNGVLIDNIGASGTKVLGNLIGLNRNGNGFSDIGNAGDGVRVSSTPQIEIGGTGSTFSNGQGNTISDNGEHGVEIVGTSSTFNKVLGNRIGTDFNGSADFGNTLDGVRIGNAGNTTIGGTVAGARNVISGNDANGVFISGTSSATFNKVQGNFIGTDANGTSDLGNAEIGVFVETPGNFIGGTATGARNVISGNDGDGVSLLGTGASGNTVQGNFIGPDVDGAQTVGGNFHGVFITAPGNLVGGTVSGAANTISGNEFQGVSIFGAGATGNRVLRNSIFENGGLGIELNNDGVTANDPRDPDTGPNNLQNFPVITSAAGSSGTTTITGTLNSKKKKNLTIQFFASPAADTSGFGEGKTFLGQRTVKTNKKGKASFTFTANQDLSGQFITATATNDATGDTSEFSQAVTAS